jgi:hyperosmotically inducible periplasmic protein
VKARFKTGRTGGRVRKDSARAIIGAIAVAVLAIGTATCANAQTSGAMPNDASAQSQSLAASPARNRPDSELARDVRRALSRAPDVHATSIHVQARQGIVTLTGWVPARAQVQRAGSVARSVRGVRHVNNRLNVRTRGASGH